MDISSDSVFVENFGFKRVPVNLLSNISNTVNIRNATEGVSFGFLVNPLSEYGSTVPDCSFVLECINISINGNQSYMNNLLSTFHVQGNGQIELEYGGVSKTIEVTELEIFQDTTGIALRAGLLAGIVLLGLWCVFCFVKSIIYCGQITRVIRLKRGVKFKV